MDTIISVSSQELENIINDPHQSNEAPSENANQLFDCHSNNGALESTLSLGKPASDQSLAQALPTIEKDNQLIKPSVVQESIGGSSRPSRRSKPNMAELVDQQRYHAFSGIHAGAFTSASVTSMIASSSAVKVRKAGRSKSKNISHASIAMKISDDSSISSDLSDLSSDSEDDIVPLSWLKDKTQSNLSGVKKKKKLTVKHFKSLTKKQSESSLEHKTTKPRKPYTKRKGLQNMVTEDLSEASNLDGNSAGDFSLNKSLIKKQGLQNSALSQDAVPSSLAESDKKKSLLLSKKEVSHESDFQQEPLDPDPRLRIDSLQKLGFGRHTSLLDQKARNDAHRLEVKTSSITADEKAKVESSSKPQLIKCPTPLCKMPRIPKKYNSLPSSLLLPETKNETLVNLKKEKKMSTTMKKKPGRRVIIASDSADSANDDEDNEDDDQDEDSEMKTLDDKPLTAYAVFFKDNVSIVRQSMRQASFKEVSQVISNMWERLSPAESNVYKLRAEENEKVYLQNLADKKSFDGDVDGEMVKKKKKRKRSSQGELEDSLKEVKKTTKRRKQSQQQQQRQRTSDAELESHASLPPRSVAALTAAANAPRPTRCQREGCTQLAIDDAAWKRQFCSTQCCVRSVRDTFQSFVRNHLTGNDASANNISMDMNKEEVNLLLETSTFDALTYA